MIEGVDEVDMGHPTVKGLVVHGTDSLDGVPQLRWRGHDDSTGNDYVRHLPCLQAFEATSSAVYHTRI